MSKSTLKNKFFSFKQKKKTQKEHYMLHVARKYEFYLFIERTRSHSFTALTRERLFSPLEHKIRIFSPPCNILYV